MSTFNDYIAESMLNEATGYIQNAGRVLFNKNKVTPDHAVSKEAGVWGDGHQSVRTYSHADDKWDKSGTRSTVTKTFHVSSHGHYDPKTDTTKIGETENFKHAQTHRDLPKAKLVGVSNYTGGKKVEHHGEDHSKTAAAFHVYK